MNPRWAAWSANVFRGSEWWVSRNRMSEMIGLPTTFILCKIGVIVVQESSNKLAALPVLLLLGSALPAYLLLLWGGYFAKFPHLVIIEQGKGLWLLGSFTRMYVPLENVREVQRESGCVVRLKRRQRLLGEFVVPITFGAQSIPLLEAIEKQIQERDSQGLIEANEPGECTAIH